MEIIEYLKIIGPIIGILAGFAYSVLQKKDDNRRQAFGKIRGSVHAIRSYDSLLVTCHLHYLQSKIHYRLYDKDSDRIKYEASKTQVFSLGEKRLAEMKSLFEAIAVIESHSFEDERLTEILKELDDSPRIELPELTSKLKNQADLFEFYDSTAIKLESTIEIRSKTLKKLLEILRLHLMDKAF